MRVIVFAAVASLLPLSIASAGDWTQWRGPNGSNVAETGQRVPTTWSATKNVAWKVPVLGRGHSSPIVVGDLIVLTSADERLQRQGVFGFDRKTGKSVWKKVVCQLGFPKTHNKNTHASATACSDGTNIYAVFNHHNRIEAIALNLKGKEVWRQDVGPFAPKRYEYGYAASPTLYNGLLIVSGEADTGAWIKALDTKSGRIAWEQDRPNALNWASPIVANVAGRDQLVLSGGTRISSYDPKTGQPLWSAQNVLAPATCGTIVWDDDTVYASGGYPKRETAAVKADGSGEVRWRNTVKCYEQSMLYHDGHLYAVDDKGIGYCWHAKSGREMWKTRLEGPVSASPVLVGDTIYASNERGTTFVFKADPTGYKEVARNQLGDSSFATPTVVDNRILLRVASGSGSSRQETLYAIGSR